MLLGDRIASKLQTEFSYLKDLFRKMNKGKSDLSHLLSVQKHTTDKTGLGYKKQTTFSKKTKFASSKRVNPNKVSKNKNIVHYKPKANTCHYCMKRRHTSYKCYVRRFDVPRGKCVWIPKNLIVETNPIGPNLNWVPPLSNLFFLVDVPKRKKLIMVLG